MDAYYRMAEIGLLAEDARVELIEGEIIDTPPIGPLHASCVSRLLHLLTLVVVGDVAIVRCELPLYARHGVPEYWIVDLAALYGVPTKRL